MVEFDIYAYLIADATLDTLLSVTATDTKIYPLKSFQGATGPYITYSNAVGGIDETLDIDRIELHIVSDNKATVNSIRDRIKTLLDLNDMINISSDTYWIYYSKLVAGDSLIDEVTDDFIEIMIFEIEYKKKT